MNFKKHLMQRNTLKLSFSATLRFSRDLARLVSKVWEAVWRAEAGECRAPDKFDSLRVDGKTGA